jgi:hypothetical protein
MFRRRQRLLQQNLGTIREPAQLGAEFFRLRFVIEIEEQTVIAKAQIDITRNLPPASPLF